MRVKWLMLIGLAALSVGCRKEEDQTIPRPPSTNLVPKCSYVPALYSGPIQSDNQIVTILADPKAFSNDLVAVFLCHIGDCAVQVPAAVCPQPPGVPCHIGGEYPQSIRDTAIDTRKVVFTNAQTDGFGSYAIQEDACL